MLNNGTLNRLTRYLSINLDVNDNVAHARHLMTHVMTFGLRRLLFA